MPPFLPSTRPDYSLAPDGRRFYVLAHRRDRMTILSSIAMDGNEKSNTRLRALRQIADEAAADLAGMIQSHAEQIDLLKRQMAGEIVALPVVQKEG